MLNPTLGTGLVVLAALCAVPASASVLTVAQSGGDVAVHRDAAQRPLLVGDRVLEGDRVTTGTGARATLRWGANSTLELGAGSELLVSRVPYASFASSLDTALRVQRGYLRVIHAAEPGWRLAVSLGPHRARLTAGEFFFQTSSEGPSAGAVCVADGSLELSDQESHIERLAPSNCYVLKNGAIETLAYDATDWEDARRAYSLTAPAPDTGLTRQGRRPRYEIVTARTTERKPRIQSAPAASAGGWALHVAALASARTAEREAARISAWGYTTDVQATENRDRTWYRVRVRGYGSRQEALQEKPTLETRLGYGGVWISPE